jgi:hypothetical protein
MEDQRVRNAIRISAAIVIATIATRNQRGVCSHPRPGLPVECGSGETIS